MHSDGLPNEPKRSHLSSLHRTLSSLNGVLLSEPAQVHRAYALPVLDGSHFTTPRVFRSGLTACDSQSPLQQWSFTSSDALAYPPQTTRLFFADPVSNASFCLTFVDDKQPVSVQPCDEGSQPSSQMWLLQQGKGPGMNFTIASVASPAACVGLDLDSNGNFLSSALVLQSCDFFDSGLSVSWNLDTHSQRTLVSSSFAKTSCASSVDAANVTAFTYGSRDHSATFVVNRDSNSSAVFLWGGAQHNIAAAATLIFDADAALLFDSANVSLTPVTRRYTPVVGPDG